MRIPMKIPMIILMGGVVQCPRGQEPRKPPNDKLTYQVDGSRRVRPELAMV
jgi:hypothetical protein